MNTTRDFSINPSIEKTFLRMLIDVNFTSGLDVKNYMCSIDPFGGYTEQSVTDKIDDFAMNFGIDSEIKLRDGKFFRMYKGWSKEEMEDLFDELFPQQVVAVLMDKFVIPQISITSAAGNYSTTNDINTTMGTLTVLQNEYTCGVYGEKDTETIYADDKNSARARYAGKHQKPYRNVFARKNK